MTRLYKYPRTLHFTWSRSMTSDDKILHDDSIFNGKRVIVSEKLDGESFSGYSDCLHARSLTFKSHPSRSVIQQIHSTIKDQIPKDWRICGENMYATHSIHYRKLTSYLYIFGIYDENNFCLGWDDVEYICEQMGLQTVPVIYDGIYDREKIKELEPKVSFFDGTDIITKEPTVEGYVVRVANKFHYDDFAKNCAKMVRKGHVKSDDHWLTKPVIPNELKG